MTYCIIQYFIIKFIIVNGKFHSNLYVYVEEATTTSSSTVSTTTVDASLAELQLIGPLNGYHHGVSGVVYIIDIKTIRIIGFSYDGKFGYNKNNDTFYANS